MYVRTYIATYVCIIFITVLLITQGVIDAILQLC